MKTLKKSLCLVLALVMVLGFGAISASADLDYEDTKDITYAEAVDVMSGIGVLEGYEDGTFLPTKEVSREEAAKIIAYLMVGSSSEADALSTTADPFEDVSKDRWSAGYIAYLVQKGVINGVGEGKFDPTGKVTGLQFAKMLLTALGYGVNDEYVGETWAINVAKDALQYGIFADNLNGANNTPATREECALYAFNTLWLKKVTYSALLGGYIENIGGNYYWTSGDPNNAESNKASTFANDFGLWIDDVDSDAFYRPVGYEYKVGKKVITATYGADQYLEASYTTPVTGNEMYNLLGSTLVKRVADDSNDKYIATVYIDGVGGEIDGDYVDEYITKSNLDDVLFTGYGISTKVYVLPAEYSDDAKGEGYTEVRVCISNTLLAEVVDVTAASKTKDAKTIAEIATIPEDNSAPDQENMHKQAVTFETEAFAEGELVLVTYSFKGVKNDAPEVQSMVAATLTDAKITRYTNKTGVPYIKAGGNEYTGAANDYVVDGQRASEINEKEVMNKTYTLILDEYGYVIGITQEAVVTNYVYVSQFGQKIDSTGSLSDYTTLSAYIWKADAESKTGAKGGVELVNIAKSDIGEQFDIESFDGNYAELIETLNEEALGLYKYTVSGGKAVLKRLTEDDFKNDVEDAQVYKGISRVATHIYATTKTTFFYVTGNYPKETVSVYTGINKVPAKSTFTSALLVEGYAETETEESDNYIYDAMLVSYEPKEEDEKSDVYFYLGNYTKEGPDADGNYTVTFEVMKNGVAQEITFTYSTASAADAAIDTASENEQMYVEALGKTLKNTAKDGYFDVLASGDYSVIKEMYKIGDVYETTLYTDTEEEVQGYYLENAKVIDLRKGGDVSTMRGLQKLTESYDVSVAFECNVKTLEVTTIYIIDAD